MPRFATPILTGLRLAAVTPRGWRFGLIVALALPALLITGALAGQGTQDDDWDPVQPKDLASRMPQVQPDADAEVLFWRVQIQDRLATFGLQSESWNYVRIKVFTQRGCRSSETMALVAGSNAAIDDVAARTIHPDGRIVWVRAEDIHVRTLIQVRRRRERVTTFVFPAVTPGSIIEYHWHETRKRALASYDRLEFQREIPVRQVSYYIEPLAVEGRKFAVKTRVFNAADLPIDKDAEGNLTVVMSNLPAAPKERWMPPTGSVRPWLLFFYADQEKGALPVWAKQLFEDQRESLKPSRVARDIAARLLVGARSEEDSLARLYSYCQIRLRNASEEGSGLGRSEIESLDDDATAERTLQAGMGTSTAINRAFCNLARAAHFDARMALAGDASDVLATSQSASRSFLTESVVAIPEGSGWRLFDPGSRSVPYGMLPWTKERALVLVPDPAAPAVIEPDPAAAESSRIVRRARLRLTEDGQLEGHVRIEHRGHLAVRERDEHAGLSRSAWRDAVAAYITARIRSGIVDSVYIDCPREPACTCAYELRVRIPGFAMTSEKRLVLAPAVFHAGHAPELVSRDRKSGIVLPFSWTEVDSLTIDIPPGFALEAVDPPVALGLGKIGTYSLSITGGSGASSLMLARSQKLLGGSIPREQYGDLWSAFRRLYQADNRVVSLARRPSR